jgi:chaperonin GroES
MIKPIRNNVLFKAFKEDAMSYGGIIVPESVRKDGCKVEIIAVGDGTPKRPMRLKPGSIAYRIQNAGQELEFEGNKYYLIDENAILATEEN